MDKNTYRAFTKIMEEPKEKKTKSLCNHLKENPGKNKIPDYQYLRRLKKIQELEKDKEILLCLNQKTKKYYNYNQKPSTNWKGLLNTSKKEELITGKRLNKEKGVYFHKSKSIDDLFKNEKSAAVQRKRVFVKKNFDCFLDYVPRS